MILPLREEREVGYQVILACVARQSSGPGLPRLVLCAPMSSSTFRALHAESATGPQGTENPSAGYI